jgi:transcriptional regulator GlxA family with amidase domain
MREHHGSDPLDVVVVVLDDGHASTAVAPIEIFHAAGSLWNTLRGDAPEPRFRVCVASVHGGAVTSVRGLRLTPERAIADVEHADVVVLAGAGWNTQRDLARNASLLPWLRQMHARGAYLAAVCTSAAFLAEAGLLDGRCATTHWAVADELRARYPAVHWKAEQFVTEDDRIFCGGGVYAAVDLSLYLVERLCGHEIALQVARTLLLSMPRGRQTGYAAPPLSPPHRDERIRAAESFLQSHFDRTLSIDALAAHVAMSRRNLARRFKAATGRVPGDYVQALRVSAARELLEQGSLSVQAIGARVGYEDVAFFRALFKRHTGMSPAEYRSRFARRAGGAR